MQNDLTEGKIGKKLLFFSLPIIAGMMLQTAFNIVDAFFVGMLGPLELAAISLTFPVFFAFIAVASGLGIGANALVSQAVGRKDRRSANNFSEHAIFIGVVLGAVSGALGILSAPLLFTFMGADAQVLPLAVQYSTPIFAGVMLTFLWFVSDAILRAEGNSITPMKNLAIAVLLNAILDPLLIFGIGPFPRLGLFGAAITTVFSDLVAAALNFHYIYGKKSKVTLALKDFRPNAGCIGAMASIGLPAAVSQALSSVGFVLLTTLVGGFGAFAIAAYGVGSRVNSVAILPILGVESAVASFAGQNIGAKNFGRARKVTMLSAKISLAFAIAAAVAVLFFSEQIMRVFSQDPQVISIGKAFLSIAPLSFVFYGFYFALQGAFEGSGKTGLVLLTNIMYWAVAVGIAYALSQSIGITGIWVGIVLAAAIECVAVTAIFYSNIWLKPDKKKKPVSCGPR